MTFHSIGYMYQLDGKFYIFKFWKVLRHYRVNAGVPQSVISNIAIYANNTTLYYKCGQASNLWRQLELASECESDL